MVGVSVDVGVSFADVFHFHDFFLFDVATVFVGADQFFRTDAETFSRRGLEIRGGMVPANV